MSPCCSATNTLQCNIVLFEILPQHRVFTPGFEIEYSIKEKASKQADEQKTKYYFNHCYHCIIRCPLCHARITAITARNTIKPNTANASFNICLLPFLNLLFFIIAPILLLYILSLLLQILIQETKITYYFCPGQRHHITYTVQTIIRNVPITSSSLYRI